VKKTPGRLAGGFRLKHTIFAGRPSAGITKLHLFRFLAMEIAAWHLFTMKVPRSRSRARSRHWTIQAADSLRSGVDSVVETMMASRPLSADSECCWDCSWRSSRPGEKSPLSVFPGCVCVAQPSHRLSG
jgi:hypothetical protein